MRWFLLRAILIAGLIAISGCAGRASSPQPITQPALPTVTLSVQPVTITSGGSATLQWISTNATSVTIDNGIGLVAPTGTRQVTPASTTTYNATASGMGGTSTSVSATVMVNPPTASGMPQFDHVAIVVEENHSYESVIGSSSPMPYLNSLAAGNGLATQYFANFHPSIDNYFMLTAGQMFANGDDKFNRVVTADNIARELIASGKAWKSYTESLPRVGYIGGDVPPYLRHHNPFTYFSDVQNSTNQLQNLVPFTQFASDLANNALPNFSFIVPNTLNDAHDGTLQQADAWLQTNIAPLIANPAFQQSGLLIIVFDESDLTDVAHGGGHVAAVIISSRVKPGFQSTTLYQHQSTLKSILEALGIPTLPGAAGDPQTQDMAEFFH